MDMDAAGINILYLAVTSVGYFAIALFLDYVLASPFIRQKFVRKSKASPATSAEQDHIQREDSDVAAERSRIRAGSGAAQDVLSIRVSASACFTVGHLSFGSIERILCFS